MTERILTDEVSESLECLATALLRRFHRGGIPLWSARRFRVFVCYRYAPVSLAYTAGGL